MPKGTRGTIHLIKIKIKGCNRVSENFYNRVNDNNIVVLLRAAIVGQKRPQVKRTRLVSEFFEIFTGIGLYICRSCVVREFLFRDIRRDLSKSKAVFPAEYFDHAFVGQRSLNKCLREFVFNVFLQSVLERASTVRAVRAGFLYQPVTSFVGSDMAIARFLTI